MAFPTIRFAAFFVVVWVVAWAVSCRAFAWKFVLLIAGLAFYAAWDWRFLALLIGSVVVTQLFAVGIARAQSRNAKRVLLWLGVGVNLGVLGWFKYAGFFVASFSELLSRLGFDVRPPVLDIALPLGLSFLTFKAIAYLVEVHRGDVAPGRFVDVAIWQTFFPSLVAGPIVRPSEFLPQLRTPPDASRVEASRAFWLIARGLFKKVVLASFLATALADRAFTTPQELSSPEVLLGVYAYAVQIYVDFSGYTDMALGLALLLGVRLPENFDRPYRASSIHEFWARWHMTLSRWLRDFLFTPLARHARGSRVAVYATLVVVMLMAGLWHGAGWTFVAFGGVHGIALAFERWRRDRRRALRRRPAPDTAARLLARRVVTFHVVCLGWIFFRSESLGDAGAVLARVFDAWGPAPLLTPLLILVLAVVIGAQYVPAPLSERTRGLFLRSPAIAQAVGLAVALVVIDVLGPEGVPPFIYFRF